MTDTDPEAIYNMLQHSVHDAFTLGRLIAF